MFERRMVLQWIGSGRGGGGGLVVIYIFWLLICCCCDIGDSRGLDFVW